MRMALNKAQWESSCRTFLLVGQLQLQINKDNQKKKNLQHTLKASKAIAPTNQQREFKKKKVATQIERKQNPNSKHIKRNKKKNG